MSIFQSFLCVDYQADGREIERITTQSYLRYDLTVRCSEGGYSGAVFSGSGELTVAADGRGRAPGYGGVERGAWSGRVAWVRAVEVVVVEKFATLVSIEAEMVFFWCKSIFWVFEFFVPVGEIL